MTVVLRQMRKSRLSTLIDQPGGVSVGMALTQARENLAKLQVQSQSIVKDAIAELAALKPPAVDDPDGERIVGQAYSLSSGVIDAAGPFEMDDLCAIASGLCDLIDAAPSDRPFDWRIVTVHAQSMQLIMSLPTEAVEARTQVLNSLQLVLMKKIPAKPAEV